MRGLMMLMSMIAIGCCICISKLLKLLHILKIESIKDEPDIDIFDKKK